MKKFKSTINYLYFTFLPMAAFSVLSGLIVGSLITLYTALAEFLAENSIKIYTFVANNPAYLPLFLLSLVVLAMIMCLLLKKCPECKGSGVPRTEGVLRDILTFKWLRVLISTIFATAITYFSGLSLGSEGPSIQIGASSAKGIAQGFRYKKSWHRYAMTGGASAGLAVAFNAPLTGLVFAMEEIHKRITPLMLLSCSLTVIVATLISRAWQLLIGGGGVYFSVGKLPELPVSKVWILIILGVTIGICASGFNVLMSHANKIFRPFDRIPMWVKLIVAFVLSGVIGLIFIDTVGSGRHLIDNIFNLSYDAAKLVILFVLKLLLISLCFSSGATGGLFIPMLTIGALIGAIFGNISIALGLESEYFTTLVVVSMTAFFGATVRTPITAVILVLELTGAFDSFLTTIITVFSAFFIPQMLHIPPLYDSLLNKIKANELPLDPPKYGMAHLSEKNLEYSDNN